MTADVLKTAVVFFVAVVLQSTLVSSVEPGGGSADLVLVTLAAVALLRGSIFGALAGFYAGFLVDSGTLGTLGLSSLLLTLAGYWIGRYGETTGREARRAGQALPGVGAPVTSRRLGAHTPLVGIAAVTVVYSAGAIALHGMLGESVSIQSGLRALPAQILLNLALTVPVFALCRRLFDPPGARLSMKDVEFS